MVREIPGIRLNINRERNYAVIVIVCFILTTYFLYASGFSVFLMISSIQLVAFSLSSLFQYGALWMSTDEAKIRLRDSPLYWMPFLFFPVSIIQQIYQILVGVENPSTLLQPSFWIVPWSFVIAWLMGLVIIRQIYIKKHSNTDSNPSN